MALKVGYDVFKGASQAGTNDHTAGVVQAEVDTNSTYHMRIQRLSDNYYWNNTSGAFQAGATAQADEIQIQGSDQSSGSISAHRRLSDRLPVESLVGIDSDGCILTVYPDGALGSGVAITLAFELDA